MTHALQDFVSNQARHCALALAATMALLAPGAQAALTFDARTSSYLITFADNTFAAADARYDVHVNMSGADGDTLPGYLIAVKTGQSGFGWAAGVNSSGGGTALAVSNVTDPAASGNSTADLAMVGGTSGAFDFGYSTPAGAFGAGFGQDWLERGTGPSEYTLDFQGGGTGLVGADGLFTVVIFVQGDWTSHGTGPGQLEFFGINPGWATNANFDQYDANLNVTLFSASAASDGSTSFGPNVRFRLHGDLLSNVPEPAPLALLTGGLLLLRLTRRS
jgi:hypothetical protein